MSLILGRPQPLASYQIESATPVAVDTDWYWTSVKMDQVNDHIAALNNRINSKYTGVDERATLKTRRAGLNEEWDSLHAHRDELETAYNKCCWNRAWLVVSSDGHIHRAPYCTTFQARTTCTLLPQASGWTKEQIVEAAGEKACTVCFPNAPVKPCTLRDPLTAEEQDAKVAEKAAKAQAAAVKAITTPEGAPLYTAPDFDHEGLNGSLVKTERAANNMAMGELKNLGWYGVEHPHSTNWIETVRRMVLALAAKRNTNARDELDAMMVKVEKNIKRDGGANLFDPHMLRSSL